MQFIKRFATSAICWCAVSLSSSAAIDVATCEEFSAVARDTWTVKTVTITNADFSCDEYTRLSIEDRKLVLTSSVGPVTFSNLAFDVSGRLDVEADVEFTGIERVLTLAKALILYLVASHSQEENGGALELHGGSIVVFEGTAGFTSISVKAADETDTDDLPRKGGAVHNEGSLICRKDVTFTSCSNYGHNHNYGSGPGGALSNGVDGHIWIYAKLTMTSNHVEEDAEGGAIYNLGTIYVTYDADLMANTGGSGGAVYQEEGASFNVFGFATFGDNTCFNSFGGAIANVGGDILLYGGGSLFQNNSAQNSDFGGFGGAIYNADGGDITLYGSTTTFSDNYAYFGGAIYNSATARQPFADDDEEFEVPTIAYPDDTVFTDNKGESFKPNLAGIMHDGVGSLREVPFPALLFTRVPTRWELVDVDRATETKITITTADLACDEFTRLSIRSEALVLGSKVGKVTFSNVSFHVFGSLIVEPDVEFTGIKLVEKNGGALQVDVDASATFEGMATFTSISIRTTDLGNGEESRRKGGAIHNKVVRTQCMWIDNLNECSTLHVAGAISNQADATIQVRGDLVMKNNEAENHYGQAEGGAIHNKGRIVVNGEVDFVANTGGSGGALYQEDGATFNVFGFANFTHNRCLDSLGGAIATIGGDVFFYGGSLFEGNSAENSGSGGFGGGIYSGDGAIVILQGSTTFSRNFGFYGGAIFNAATMIEPYGDANEEFKVPRISFPDDTLFLNNTGKASDGIEGTDDLKA
eukprot:jgi/Undpi1/1261/HiC_scaffold_109.g14175.m1